MGAAKQHVQVGVLVADGADLGGHTVGAKVAMMAAASLLVVAHRKQRGARPVQARECGRDQITAAT